MLERGQQGRVAVEEVAQRVLVDLPDDAVLGGDHRRSSRLRVHGRKFAKLRACARARTQQSDRVTQRIMLRLVPDDYRVQRADRAFLHASPIGLLDNDVGLARLHHEERSLEAALVNEDLAGPHRSSTEPGQEPVDGARNEKRVGDGSHHPGVLLYSGRPCRDRSPRNSDRAWSASSVLFLAIHGVIVTRCPTYRRRRQASTEGH